MTAPLVLFAVCPRGLEPVLAAELEAVGATGLRPEPGGVGFGGDLACAYRANLETRIASRVLLQLAAGPGTHEDEVHALAAAVRWEDWFTPRQRLRVDLSATRSPLASLDFTTLRIKDAIVDRLRDRCGERPSIDRARPEVRVFAHCGPRQAAVYVDLSGEALFKRGWRADKGEAPLKENLAAGVLALSGWTPQQPLLDPMCGSGTIVIEAAAIAARRAPGLDRRFGFERLGNFDRGLWRRLHEEAQARAIDAPPASIEGRDISTRVVELAARNAQAAGLGGMLATGGLRFAACDARAGLPPAGAAGLVVSNPPYGERSTPRSASVPGLMRDVGDRLKASFAGWQTWWLSADLDLPRRMHLQERRRTVLFNGALECRLFRFDLVSGTYRAPRAEGGPSP